jgi:small redox-active disulfide protein 2
MKIEIYGTGCKKCRDLFENASAAVAECGVSAEVIKVEDIAQITDAGVFFTPAIAIDGEVKSSGKLLSVDDLKKLIT